MTSSPPAGRSPNRLAGSTSPYLLQHQFNPVDWHPWGEEALALARREDRPIFLSIGYSACHWCHVMERESFENEKIARILNESFVCIKVDREERPDLDEVYMTATQLLTQSGGWPMSVFLTPQIRPFYAGTYFPPEDRWGRPGFATLLLSIARAWKERRAELDEQAARIAGAIAAHLAVGEEVGTLSAGALEEMVRQSAAGFDATAGGFGSAPKFPPSMRLELLLQRWDHPEGAAEYRRIITLTLDRMARGGMYDQIGGGFHRYSVDAEWLVPHFEKMLYDNALLARVYALAWEKSGNWYWKRVARETLDYAAREMLSPEGGFYSATDADSEGEEGRFFVWTPQQVAEILTPEEADLFCKIYDIRPGGNFEGASIPNLIRRGLDEVSEELGRAPEALDQRLKAMREALYLEREKREHPLLDDKIVAAWNGLMLRAFVCGARVFQDDRYASIARDCARFITGPLMPGGRLLRSYRAGVPGGPGYLEDYAAAALGLLELHSLTHEQEWLDRAVALVDATCDLFGGDETGAFYFTAHDHEELIARSRSLTDGATPSGNSLAALALLRATLQSPRRKYEDVLARLLGAAASQMPAMPAAFPNMLIACTEYQALHPEAAALGDGEVVALSLLTNRDAVAPGEKFCLAIRLEIDEGYHLQGPNPVQPHLIATQLIVEPPAGSEVEEQGGSPPLRRSIGGEPMAVYEKSAVLWARLRAGEEAQDELVLRVRVRYQPCSDRACLQPVEAEATLRLPVGEGKERNQQFFREIAPGCCES